MLATCVGLAPSAEDVVLVSLVDVVLLLFGNWGFEARSTTGNLSRGYREKVLRNIVDDISTVCRDSFSKWL